MNLTRKLFVVLSLLVGFQSLAANEGQPLESNESIQGKWHYIGHFYQDVFQKPMNPNLVLTFEFTEDGTSRLRWHRTNENGFCERTGKYSFDGKHILDEVTWVNPENTYECGKDPDMQLGHKTETPARLVDGNLQTDLPLGDSFLIFVWEKVTE
jgi:hypothetical protein